MTSNIGAELHQADRRHGLRRDQPVTSTTTRRCAKDPRRSEADVSSRSSSIDSTTSSSSTRLSKTGPAPDRGPRSGESLARIKAKDSAYRSWTQKREGIPDRERLRSDIRRASDAPRGRALSRGSLAEELLRGNVKARRHRPCRRSRREADLQRRRTAKQRSGQRELEAAIRRAGAPRYKRASIVRRSRGCRFASSRDWRGLTRPARFASRRRHRACGWRSCVAICVG